MKLVTLISLVDIAILYLWALTLYSFSPFRIFLSLLLAPLPKNLASSDQFQGNILPLFILPIIIIVNLIYFKLNQIKPLTNILLSIVSILIGMGIFFGPGVIGDNLSVYTATNKMTIVGEPTFILQKNPSVGNFYFSLYLPIKMGANFKGHWMGNFYKVSFSPSDEVVLSNITACQFDKPYLSTSSLQPPSRKENTPAGNYNLEFIYSFSGPTCSINGFKELIGKNIELIDISKSPPKILKTFTIQNYSFKQ